MTDPAEECQKIVLEGHDSDGGLWGAITYCTTHNQPVARCEASTLKAEVERLREEAISWRARFAALEHWTGSVASLPYSPYRTGVSWDTLIRGWFDAVEDKEIYLNDAERELIAALKEGR